MRSRVPVFGWLALLLSGCGDFADSPSTPDALQGKKITALAMVRHGDVLCVAAGGNVVSCLDLVGSSMPKGKVIATSVAHTVIALAGGYEDICALESDATVTCWRTDGTTTPAVAAQGVAELAVSENGELCTRMAGGGVQCLCDRSPTTKVHCASPVGLNGSLDLGGHAATQIAAGGFFECAVLDDGTVRCRDGTTGRSTTIPGFADVVELGVADRAAGGTAHFCARLAGGTVSCSGSNVGGELGDGNGLPAAGVVGVTGLTGVVQLAVGGSHNCARKTDGTVWCWGMSGLFAGGNTVCMLDAPCSTVPVEVQGLSNAARIIAGDLRDCALLPDGTVRCWGGWRSNRITGPTGGG